MSTSVDQPGSPTTDESVSEGALLEFLSSYKNRGVPGSGIARVIGSVIPQSLRPVARVVATNAIAPFQRRTARRLAVQTPLKLNVGCGNLPLDGWINIDLVGLPVDVAWNLTKALPFEDNSVDVIFHEHVLEHVDALNGYHFLRNCFRVLKPGGIMRIVLPDAGKYISSYCDPRHEFLESWRGIPFTPLMAVQEEFYNFGHQAMYDSRTLDLFCRTVGFRIIEPKQFGESRLEPCPDSEWRIMDSFYTEVVK